MNKQLSTVTRVRRAVLSAFWFRLVVLSLPTLLLVACGGDAFATATPIPASVVRPVQPSPVYSTAQPRFRLEDATPEPIFVTPPAESANLSAIAAQRAPAQPVMPQFPTAMGIATGGATLVDEPRGRAVTSLPAGGVVTVTGRSTDGGWLAVFTSDGTAGWISANSLRLFGDDDLTTVEHSFSMAPVATLLAEAMLPVASPMSDYLASLTATPMPPGAGLVGVVVSNSRLNVRAAPAADAEIVGKIELQATVTVIGKDAEQRWLQVRLGDNVGWVAAEFVRLQGDGGTLPTVGE